MTRAKISEYSATANDNTDVNGINIAEGCPPSSMNNMGREIMAALKRFQVGSDGDGVTVGGSLVVSGSTSVNTFNVDVISEKTSAAGVTVDGVLLKDSQVSTDQINEKTSAAGVTIDGVLLKDSGVNGLTVGLGAGSVSTNTAVGASALAANTTGANNTAVGYQALDANTTGYRNTAVGSGSLGANTGGYQNTAVGQVSLAANTTGINNTGLGYFALNANTTGNNNTAVGYAALEANTTGADNTAVGYGAGDSITTGTGNTVIGSLAGPAITTGVNNTFVGKDAGEQVTTGSKNTILGRYNGNGGGLDIRTSSNNIVLSDGDGNPRARWDSSGKLALGYSPSVDAGHAVRIVSQAGEGALILDGGATNGYYAMVVNMPSTNTYGVLFKNDGSNVGDIRINSSSTAYNTSSDYRLKENIAPMTGALSTVAQLNPVTYTWKSTGESSQGFIAHELQAVVPDCVTGEKDAVDVNGNPVYQGIDTSFLVATLTAAIQELSAKCDSLQAEVNTLKGQ